MGEMEDRVVWYEYRGAVHIHSWYSDGGGGWKQITRAGIKAGLDFLIITDHNHLKLKKKRKEGWFHNRLLVLVGEEVSHSDQHVLALGIERDIPADLPPEASLEAIRRQGGVAIIAHPDGQYRFFLRTRDHRWKAWQTDRFDGMEIWSYMLDWVEKVKPWNLAAHLFNPDRAIDGPPPQTLQRWDALNTRRRVVGIAGVDAHARGIWPLQVFPYEFLFRRMATYILLKEPLSEDGQKAGRQLMEAIRQGHAYFAYEAGASARGFRFWVQCNGKQLLPGDRMRFAGPARLYVELPKRADFEIVHNGRTLFRANGKRWNMELIRPGVYRVVAYRQAKPWIYSNPVVLEDPLV